MCHGSSKQLLPLGALLQGSHMAFHCESHPIKILR